MRTVIALGHAGMGHGDPELGRRILANFLRKSLAIGDLTAILLFNSGVTLAAKDSPVIVELRQLQDNGVDVLACATCVDAYAVRESLVAGDVSSMDQIIAEMAKAEKVITL